MRSSCQTRALIRYESGQGETRMSVSANATSLSHGRRETSLFPALLHESGLKPSLATTHAKAFTPCDHDPLGFDDEGTGDGSRFIMGRGMSHLFSLRSSCQNESLGKTNVS
ncbi:hypothetical protein [Desulfosporosinus sp.]|uniref:hypothetical protein n=1 Tax=Desulfosporosinus sp. TaxID=157907 RepID=UPI002621885C|nr:hypothetical protein [Desulfosporosinus sp.]